MFVESTDQKIILVRSYVRYYREPIYENGIQIRDMLVFSHDLTD